MRRRRGDGALANEGDARAPAIMRRPNGRRGRIFGDASAVLQESNWLDWPIEGPRSVVRVVRFIAQQYEPPVFRQSWWMTEARPRSASAPKYLGLPRLPRESGGRDVERHVREGCE